MKNDNIIEIPPEIYYRLSNKGNQIMISSNKDGISEYMWIPTGIKKSLSDGKYYLYTAKDISTIYIGFYLLSWYVLKDI